MDTRAGPTWGRRLHRQLRRAAAHLPKGLRFALQRRLVDVDPLPDSCIELKIADTQDELEACFRLLHDAHVGSGLMQPDPSGLHVTIFHALPSTTTLCAKVDGRVVGTLSLIRDGVFGLPLQSFVNLSRVRAGAGHMAEVAALAIDPKFRGGAGGLLFPLMKFLYDYCRSYFDTRHLLIAVDPARIEMYESLLFFERLADAEVGTYDFAQGAPAVGARLDLQALPARLKQGFGGRPARRDLYRYFVEARFPNVVVPQRRYFTTNDPVMTPAMLDHFFNRRTAVFATLDERRRMLLRSIYDLPAYRDVLPAVGTSASTHTLRCHRRFSLKCPAVLTTNIDGLYVRLELEIIEVSQRGFLARCREPVTLQRPGIATVELGRDECATLTAVAVRADATPIGTHYGFRIDASDPVWQRCVHALQQGQTHADLSSATATATATAARPIALHAAA